MVAPWRNIQGGTGFDEGVVRKILPSCCLNIRTQPVGLRCVHTDRMSSSRRVRQLSLKVMCVRMCVFYSAVALADAAKLRCGTDLLNDLLFVCGDRGIYLGKGSRSGYGARPRGKGIVDQCCRLGGCGLHVLEMYCAKPKSPQDTTAEPSAAAASQPNTTQQLQRRLAEHLGATRDADRKRGRVRSSWSHRGTPPSATIGPPSASASPLQRATNSGS